MFRPKETSREVGHMQDLRIYERIILNECCRNIIESCSELDSFRFTLMIGLSAIS
jgi:hypothetical protein